MTCKTYISECSEEDIPASQIGATIEALAATIAARRGAGEGSYTYRLLAGCEDTVLKKLMEEAGEVALAAKDAERVQEVAKRETVDAEFAREVIERESSDYDAAVDHLRYEAADVIYHLLVVLERYGISADELAAALNNRMTEEERPRGSVRLHDEYVRRGK